MLGWKGDGAEKYWRRYLLLIMAERDSIVQQTPHDNAHVLWCISFALVLGQLYQHSVSDPSNIISSMQMIITSVR